MAEVLAIAGGIALFNQILLYAAKASLILNDILHKAENAPTALRQIRDKLVLLNATLESFQQFLSKYDDDAILPQDFRLLLENVIWPVFECAEKLEHVVQKAVSSDIKRKRKRMQWAFLTSHVTKTAIDDLNRSEENHNRLIQILNLLSSFYNFFLKC